MFNLRDKQNKYSSGKHHGSVLLAWTTSEQTENILSSKNHIKTVCKWIYLGLHPQVNKSKNLPM